MKILAIETSCDETAASLLQAPNNKYQMTKKLKVTSFKLQVLSNVVLSQVKIHAKYGGIVPEVAARKHVEGISMVLEKALGNFQNDIDLIAVTSGPGLITSLMVGLETARVLSWFWKKPLININHLAGHIYSNWLSHPDLNNKNIFPSICLVVSGGHTELYLMKGHGKYQLLGRTRDDAVGEAFDKVAKILNLGYPGGPVVAKYAGQYNYQVPNSKYPALPARIAKCADRQTNSKIQKSNYQNNLINFPRPMINSGDYDFSFSGLKTAVLYEVKKYSKSKIRDKKILSNICFSFQQAAIDVLVTKTIKAAKAYNVKNIMLSGGVSANIELREELGRASQEFGIKFYCPELKYTGDNAAMIAVAGYYKYLKVKNKKNLQSNWQKINPEANWELV